MLPVPKALSPPYLRTTTLNGRAKNQTWRHSRPQLKDINGPWTAFLNRRVFVTGEQSNFCTKPWLKEEVQAPWTDVSHDSLSPSRSCRGSQDWVCAVPLAGPWGPVGHTAVVPGTTPASSLCCAQSLTRCQHGALNYFSLSNLRQQLHPKRSGLFSLWQCLWLLHSSFKSKTTKKKARDANDELFTFYSSPLPQRFNKLSSLCEWIPRCLSGLNIFKGPETPSLWFKLLLIMLQILVYFSTSGGI